MINHDSKNEVPVSAPRGGRLRRSVAYIAAAIAGVTLVGAFASSPVGLGYLGTDSLKSAKEARSAKFGLAMAIRK
jgi:hypothetical protein